MATLQDGSSYHNPILNIKDALKREKIQQVTGPFVLTKDTVLRLRKIFDEELDQGLESGKQGSLCQECTFITNLPDGSEKGDFLSLDLGSTNFRVLLSRLNPGGQDDFQVKYYDVPTVLRTGKAQKLFDFIAECIADFLSERPDLLSVRLPLGFTFSYPMVQEAIDCGRLVTWTKSYDLPDALGKNAVDFLRAAIEKRPELNVEVVAILNDSSGTLVKGCYDDRKCGIGMIIGSGFNACYLEKVNKIKKLTAQQVAALEGAEEVLVDIECGGFGDKGSIDFIKTDIDREIDQESLFVNSFSYEKMFAGNFLGDVVRRVLLSLTKKGLLFDGLVMSGLRTKDAFTAAHSVGIEKASNEGEVKNIIKVLGFELDEISSDDVAIVRYVVGLIGNRAAILGSFILASLIDRMAKEEIGIAIDGSLYKHHPKMHTLLTDYISELAPGRKFKIFLAEDGSGKGAGLVAAAVKRGH